MKNFNPCEESNPPSRDMSGKVPESTLPFESYVHRKFFLSYSYDKGFTCGFKALENLKGWEKKIDPFSMYSSRYSQVIKVQLVESHVFHLNLH